MTFMIMIFLFIRKICEKFICFISKAKNTAVSSGYIYYKK